MRIVTFVLIIFVVFIAGCVGVPRLIHENYLVVHFPLNEGESIIERVNFSVRRQVLDIRTAPVEARDILQQEAQKLYPNRTISIRNVKISFYRGDFSGTGDVIDIEGTPLNRALDRALSDVSHRSRILVTGVSDPGEDRDVRRRITDEVENWLLNHEFIVVDRQELDRIRTEQSLGFSGEFDERTTVELGGFTGANFFLNVRIDDETITVRVVDVHSATVTGIATERL